MSGRRDQNAVPERHPSRRLHSGRDEVGLTNEVGYESGGRMLVDLLRGAHLKEPALVHHSDPVRHRERFFLVVGHVDEGDAHPLLELLQLQLHGLAQLQIEGSEGFVQQQHLGRVHQRSRQRHPLLLPSGELLGLALLHAAELHQLHRAGYPLGDCILRHPLHLQPEGDVLSHGHVGEQGVGLEDGVDGPLVGRTQAHLLAEDTNAALAGELQAGDDAQGRGLAASRRPQQ